MIEAERKYIVPAPAALRRHLGELTKSRSLTYADTYFDHPNLNFIASESELRIRVISGEHSNVETLLTFKGEIVDSETESKTEYEARLEDDPQKAVILLEAMGFERLVTFTKICDQYNFMYEGYQISATMVKVPEIDKNYLELETLLEQVTEMTAALSMLSSLAARLGLRSIDETTEGYSDMVIRARSKDPHNHRGASSS